MSWLDKVYLYCERGLDPSFWAEPLNAISNASFLVAAAIAAMRHRKVPQEVDGRSRLAIWGLIALVAGIGIGSFVFHTFATRWALIADVVPITVFMVSYLAFALRKFVALSWISIAVVLLLFAYTGHIAGSLTCAGAENGPRIPCLNGSLGYLPALLCLWAVGSASVLRGNEAGRWLLVAGGIFLVSAGFRTIDRDLCAHARIGGQMVGTHAFWHVLNALTLYILLIAAITHRPKTKLEAKTA